MTDESGQGGTGESSGRSGSVYQMVTLTPGLSDKLISDDSPQTLIDEIWEFLNAQIMTANLSDVDFQNIMDYVDIRFANMLTGIPEDRWSDFKIIEKEWVPDGQGGAKLEKKGEYHITELWDQIRAKVYIKCCNSRNGHLIKTLTESRSHVSQSYEERGVSRPPEYQTPTQAYPGPEQARNESGGWKP